MSDSRGGLRYGAERRDRKGLGAVLRSFLQRPAPGIVFGAIAAGWVLTTLLGRWIVELIYAGRAPAFLNAMMRDRSGHPVAHFYEISDRPVLAVYFLFAVVALMWFTRARRSPAWWFGLLVAGDVGLLLLALVSRSVLLTIWHEWSIPEFYCYFKELLFAFLMYRVFKARGERVFACLSLLGIMLFLDDAGAYHERMGRILAPLATATGLPQILQVRPHYLGEVLSLVPYVVLAAVGLYYYVVASPRARAQTRVAVGIIAALFVFGVILDITAHVGLVKAITRFFVVYGAFIEDFGEMVILSGLATYSAALAWQHDLAQQ